MSYKHLVASIAIATSAGFSHGEPQRGIDIEDDSRICLQNFGGTIHKVGCDIEAIIRSQGGPENVIFVPTVTLPDGTEVNELRDKENRTILGIVTSPNQKQ